MKLVILSQKVYLLVVIPIAEAPIYLGFISKKTILFVFVSEDQ